MQTQQNDRQAFDNLIESLRREAFTAYESIREAQRGDDDAMQSRFAALQHAGESACRIYSSIAILNDAVLSDELTVEEQIADVHLRELVSV